MVELHKIHIRFGKNTHMHHSVLYQKFTINKNVHVYSDIWEMADIAEIVKMSLLFFWGVFCLFVFLEGGQLK